MFCAPPGTSSIGTGLCLQPQEAQHMAGAVGAHRVKRGLKKDPMPGWDLRFWCPVGLTQAKAHAPRLALLNDQSQRSSFRDPYRAWPPVLAHWIPPQKPGGCLVNPMSWGNRVRRGVAER